MVKVESILRVRVGQLALTDNSLLAFRAWKSTSRSGVLGQGLRGLGLIFVKAVLSATAFCRRRVA